MNFQKIPKIESTDKLLDLAFSRATKTAELTRSKRFKHRFDKSQKIELAKLSEISETLKSHITSIIKSFPSLDDLPEFYKELIKTTLDYPYFKKSLGSLSWLRNKINVFHRTYQSKINKTQDMNKINAYRREFYGRISSLLRQIKKHLEYLENARKTMKNFPDVKDMKTVAIFGFPNTGKTTLLSKLSGSTPEIDSYPFTTKGINVGYMAKEREKIQLLDTPGTLSREDKMNIFEQQAMLALKYCAEKVIYVFDLTEPFPLKDQMALFKKIKKPIIIFLSKADILEKDIIDRFITEFSKSHKSTPIYISPQEIKKSI